MAETVMGTFLFTDLVGSTALSSSLGQAAADELRQSHFSLLRGAVSVTGGTEVKNLGEDAAAALYQLLEPHAALHAASGPIYYGYTDRAVGRVAMFLGRADEGEERLRHSLEVHRAIGARYWGARNAIDLAEALILAGRAADDVEVAALLQEARTSSESAGYGRELKRLDLLADR